MVLTANYENPEEPERLQFINAFLSVTPHVQEVLIEFMNCNNYQEIADKLNIAPNTVSQHISKFCKQLKLNKKFPSPDFSSKDRSLELKRLLRKYANDIAVAKISRDLKKVYPNYPSKQKGRIIITININPLKVNLSFILNLLREFQRFFGDDSMRIDKIEEGSIKLTITGTVEGCQRIKSLFDTGELTEILDVSILDVSPVEVETADNIWTKLGNWLQSNILPDWELEETVSATIAAFKSHPDFAATPAFGVQMSANNEVELNTAIAELLASLNSQDLDIVRLAAQGLAEVEANTPEVINSLKEKLNATDDVETQWQIALALSKVSPDEHPNAKAQKQIVELGDIALEIVLGIKNDEDDFVDILVEIRPDWDNYLPTGLEVKILEESGEDFWQDEFVSTQLVIEEQAYIYFSFWGTWGDKFILQLTLEDTVLQKHFQI